MGGIPRWCTLPPYYPGYTTLIPAPGYTYEHCTRCSTRAERRSWALPVVMSWVRRPGTTLRVVTVINDRRVTTRSFCKF